MTETQTRETPFIGHLASLANQDDRAALAALRRGLGRAPGMAPELYPHVARFFPRDGLRLSRDRENAMFTVAALFGMVPNHSVGAGSPLKVLRQVIRDRNLESGSTERRVLSLLNADVDSLPTHLRHLIALIRSHGPERRLDYEELLRDVSNWSSADRWVQRNWASDWWGGPAQNETDDTPDTTGVAADTEEVST